MTEQDLAQTRLQAHVEMLARQRDMANNMIAELTGELAVVNARLQAAAVEIEGLLKAQQAQPRETEPEPV